MFILGPLESTYSRLPIDVNLTFFRYVLRLRRYKRISIENRRFCLKMFSFAQNFRYNFVPTNHSLCRKTTINVLSYGIRMSAQVSFVLSQCARLIDRRTGRRTDRRAEMPSKSVRCITRSRKVTSRPAIAGSPRCKNNTAKSVHLKHRSSLYHMALTSKMII